MATVLKDFNETYARRLLDAEYLNAYLAACLEEGPETFFVGIRKAVQARDDGFTWLANQTGIGRKGLYKALSSRGNPSFRTVYKIFRALGVSEILISHAQGNDPAINRDARDLAPGSALFVIGSDSSIARPSGS